MKHHLMTPLAVRYEGVCQWARTICCSLVGRGVSHPHPCPQTQTHMLAALYIWDRSKPYGRPTCRAMGQQTDGCRGGRMRRAVEPRTLSMIRNSDPGKHARIRARTHTHTALACMTCKRLRKSAEECCKLGHHAASHVARRPQLQLCPLHNLPPCPRCTLKQRGVRHCCDRGHHKVCTPVPAHRKRTLPMQSLLPHKKPCLQRPAQHSSGLLRSPHQPPTPPAPKRRRPKTPPPPSPPAPVPQGLEGDEAEDAVARPLFLSRHGRASTSAT